MDKSFAVELLEITQPERPYNVQKTMSPVTWRKCQHLSGSQRKITIDRWFLSFDVKEGKVREMPSMVICLEPQTASSYSPKKNSIFILQHGYENLIQNIST